MSVPPIDDDLVDAAALRVAARSLERRSRLADHDDAGRTRSPGRGVTTMLVRPGSGLPIDSKVLRPITTGLPMVSALKCLRSEL